MTVATDRVKKGDVMESVRKLNRASKTLTLALELHGRQRRYDRDAAATRPTTVEDKKEALFHAVRCARAAEAHAIAARDRVERFAAQEGVWV